MRGRLGFDMQLRNALARLALADARRFEMQCLGMLRDVLACCTDEATRQLIASIIAEEEEHIRHLDETAPTVRSTSAAASEATAQMPAAPQVASPVGSVCDKLREVLKAEDASARFYELLASRSLIPAVRSVFEHIAEEESGHARRLAEHIRQLCGPPAG